MENLGTDLYLQNRVGFQLLSQQGTRTYSPLYPRLRDLKKAPLSHQFSTGRLLLTFQKLTALYFYS